MFFSFNRSIVIADPSLLEEKRSEATVVFGINSYRELCGLHFGGITIASLNQLIKCANQGAKRANAVVKQIKNALEIDAQNRLSGKRVGFIKSTQYDGSNASNENRVFIRLAKFHIDSNDEIEKELEELKKEQAKIKSLGNHSAILMPAEELSSDDENDMWIPEMDGDIQSIDEQNIQMKSEKSKQFTSDDNSGDSEEEETVIIENIT